jgi:DDE family transposase
MTTIPQVAQIMQTVLRDEAERAGWQTGFVQRSDAKLSGSIFTQTLLFGLAADPHASLSALTQTSAALGVMVSAEALHQRFDRRAASCLEQVLGAAVRQIVAADPIVLPILDRFSEVVAQDSTSISLPEVLAQVWQGCGNGGEHAGNAALKLHLALDLCSGRLRGPHLVDGRESDRNATLESDLPQGAGKMVDLGLWDLALLARLKARGVYWFSRCLASSAIQTADGRWWQLLELLNASPQATLDLSVRLGVEDQVDARLLAVRAPQEVVDQRRRRLREEAREKGQTVSALRLALAAWTVFVTTIPPELLNIEEALVLSRARWQIELLFKVWKSHGQIDLVREVQAWRVLCELYGRLLGQIVQHWLLLVSCWHNLARSLPKAAQTIRAHSLALATAMARRARLEEAITTLARCIGAGCRMNRRKKHPNTYQRFLAVMDSCST